MKEREYIILLAEDDPDDILLTKDALKDSKAKGELKVVKDGVELLDYLSGINEKNKKSANPRPDLIILDLNMPKMDGREVLKKIKADERYRSIPIIVLTTSKQPEDIEQTYNLGVNSFITKPIKYESLVEIMKRLGEYWFDTVRLPAK